LNFTILTAESQLSVNGKEAAPVGGAASPSVHPSRGLLHRVGGRGVGLRLQRAEIIGCLLRVAGGGEDRPLVVLQDLQPWRDLGGVVVASFRRDAKIGA
jgi:hypothetical protein